jgi:hypothetical protein
MEADLAEEISEVEGEIRGVKAQLKALPAEHAERQALQSQLASLREKEVLLLRQQGTRLHGPMCIGTACQPPAWVFSAGAPSPGPDNGPNRPGGFFLLERSLSLER